MEYTFQWHPGRKRVEVNFFFFENLMPELLLLTYYTPVVIGLDIELLVGYNVS